MHVEREPVNRHCIRKTINKVAVDADMLVRWCCASDEAEDKKGNVGVEARDTTGHSTGVVLDLTNLLAAFPRRKKKWKNKQEF